MRRGARGEFPDVRDGAPLPTDAEDAVATAELIDSCYTTAGFPLRPRTRL